MRNEFSQLENCKENKSLVFCFDSLVTTNNQAPGDKISAGDTGNYNSAQSAGFIILVGITINTMSLHSNNFKRLSTTSTGIACKLETDIKI